LGFHLGVRRDLCRELVGVDGCAVCVWLRQIAGDQVRIGLCGWGEAEGDFLAREAGQALLVAEGRVVDVALIGIGIQPVLKLVTQIVREGGVARAIGIRTLPVWSQAAIPNNAAHMSIARELIPFFC
jgi:hypothetical protein